MLCCTPVYYIRDANGGFRNGDWAGPSVPSAASNSSLDFQRVKTPKFRLVRQDETRREHFAWRKAIDRLDY